MTGFGSRFARAYISSTLQDHDNEPATPSLKKSIWIFLLAVLLPSVVLGWLALRSAEEQQIILERRTAELCQKETDAVADAARTLVDDERRAFSAALSELLAKEAPAQLARDFSSRLATTWSRKAVGFALAPDGQLLSPSPQESRKNTEWQTFITGNSGFLSNVAPAQVFSVAPDDLNRSEQMRKKSAYDSKAADPASGRSVLTKQAEVKSKSVPPLPAPAPARKLESARALPALQKDASAAPTDASKPLAESRAAAPAAAAPPMPQAAEIAAPEPTAPAAQGASLSQAIQADRQDSLLRNVAPQRSSEDNRPAVSQLVPETAEFRALTVGVNEGVVTRFIEDRLQILFWQRAPQAPAMIFGCMLQAENLREVWSAALPAPAYESRANVAPEFVIALLDDKARPVATQPPGETGRDWKRPFVASEIGEALPHWEATLYLMRPQQLQESARSVRRTFLLLIAAAIGAIACGGWVVVADARRQMALAQQKTDFVSNVSHELKTPLTSIRMFAELMQNGAPEAKRVQYLRIIMVEAERLTRLINNVLDFARIERRQKQYNKHPLDLHALLARTWENQELHLNESGFTTRWEAAPPPYPVLGDEDALAQILVNLLSNAEKYCGDRKEIELRSTIENGFACVSVLDRGLGVPVGQERKIFEAFHRAHDSLASGIQGSGLGLTLAQRVAREHGGEITYEPREGGGSIFTLRLPLAAGVTEPRSNG